MKGLSFSRKAAVLGVLIAAMALALAGSASAKFIRKPLGPFGSASQPSFVGPAGLAVDQGTGELYVLSGGLELQSLKVSATAGQLRLKFKGETTADIAFNAPARENPGSVQTALEALPSIGAGNVQGFQGPGDATGSHPYIIAFTGALANTDLEQLSCENGATPLSGGSGCSVTTTQDGEPTQVTRWNADGTPSDFSGLGSNAIDGSGPGEDQTPDNTLNEASYIAIDESGGATDGDIYVARRSKHVLDVFAPSGKYLGQLNGFEEGPNAEGSLNSFDRVCGVTVDQAGNVYVSDASFGINFPPATLTIHKYHPGTSPVANADNVANFAAPYSSASCVLAAGTGPNVGYLFSSGATDYGSGVNSPEIFKLDSSTGEKKTFFAGSDGKPLLFAGGQSLAVDPVNGAAVVGNGAGEIGEFDASGSAPPKAGYTFKVGSAVEGLAAGGSGLFVARRESAKIDVYSPALIVPDVTTETASDIAGTSATLNGTIGAANGPSSSCHFQYTTEAAYLADVAISGHDGFTGAQSAPCEPAGPFTGSVTNAVSAKATALSPETKYRFRIVGENENGSNVGEVERDFTNPACPLSRPTCPLLLETLGKPAIKGGVASEVTTTKAKISGEVNPRGLPSEYAVQYVTEADFEASGYAKALTVPGVAKATGAGFAPVSVQLGGLEVATTYHFRLIASNEAGTADPGEDNIFATFAEPAGLPDGRAYEQVSPAVKLGEVFPPEQGGLRPGMGGTCRGCVPGWAKARMPMQVTPDGNAIAYEGNPFTAGLASGPNQYIASRGAGGWATTPLSGAQYEDAFGAGFKAFSRDLSRGVLYQVAPPLTPDAPSDYANLYLWQAGAALQPLITEAPPSRSAGTEGVNPFRLAYAGANAGTASSPPFSHLVFGANDALTEEVPGIAPKAPPVGVNETDLYEWSGGQLHLVNVLPGNNASAANAVIGSGGLLGGGGVFETAEYRTFDFDHAISDDGSRVFWSEQPSGQVYVREGATSTTKVPDPGKFLTASADGSKVLLSNGHVFNLEDESTTDLTEGKGGFEGILGSSEDLARVYFVDTEALTAPSQENGNGEHAEEGAFNLYLSDEGATTFIAALSAQDGLSDFAFGTWKASPANRLAQVSPDGRYLAFESQASLTGYDSRYRDAKPGAEGCQFFHLPGRSPECYQVFEYDAANDSLHCASCNPTGERPLGWSNLSLIQASPEPLPQPRNLPPDGEGRLFFESQDVLSPADKNGHIQDVYEWQPDGVGGCERPRGCISLISGGQGTEDSHFVDATPSGKDAFFATWDQLVPFDKDDLMDLYDARVGGGFEFSAQEPCLGEACKGGSSAAAAVETPGTAGFSEAVSTPKPKCKKGSVKKRGRCVSKKKKHHHKRAAKHNRGGAK